MAGDSSDRGEGGRRMNVHGIEVKTRNIPKLDRDFVPIHQFNQSFLKTAGKPIGIAITRNNAQTAVYHTFIHGTPQMWSADTFYIDRLIKTLLWIKGGYKIYIAGDKNIFAHPHPFIPHRALDTHIGNEGLFGILVVTWVIFI